MPKIVVEVMPKPVLLDPQGKAVSAVLARQGASGEPSVRIGKRFEITVTTPVTDDLLGEVRKYAEDFLSNPVIEDVVSIDVVEQA